MTATPNSEVLQSLAALDPLKSDFRVSHKKEGEWHLFPCKHPKTVYLRNVLSNEILFECDTASYDEQRPQIERFVAHLHSLGVEPLVAWSGSKSFHVSVIFDPTTAFDSRALVVDGDKVDLLRVARTVPTLRLSSGRPSE